MVSRFERETPRETGWKSASVASRSPRSSRRQDWILSVIQASRWDLGSTASSCSARESMTSDCYAHPDPRITQQMLDLTPYRRVSSQPAVRRDLSIATGADTTKEELGDRVRTAL